MTTSRRFLWGGIGGLAPILATFLILEGDIIGRYLSELAGGGSVLTMVGYGVRVVGLFIVGGLWASLHKSERDPKKLFQLGIVAPAMITGMISASNLNAEAGPMPPSGDVASVQVERAAPAPAARVPSEGTTSSRGVILNREQPQTEQPQTEQPQTEQPPPEPNPIKSFIRGLLGRR